MAASQLSLTILNNPYAVYYPGDTIEASVKFFPQVVTPVTGIFAKFKGLAYTHWTTGTGDNRRRHTQTEQYFKVELALLGSCSLMPGQYEYPVGFVVPSNIPSSYEGGTTGHVRYLIKVKVAVTDGNDYRVQYPFTVITVLNLNYTPEATMPAQMTDTETSCCLCCKAGPVYCMIRVDRRGYAPGESIPVHAEITNRDRRSIRSSTVSLTMITVYKAHASTTRRENVIVSLTHGAVAPGSSSYWRGELLHVPPTPPSGLQGCSIIDLSYVCRLHANMEGSPMGITFDLPIIIGTIPLQDYYAAPQQPTAPLPSTWAPGSQPGAGGFSDMAAMSHPVTSQPAGYTSRYGDIMTGATCGAGDTHSSGIPDLAFGFCEAPLGYQESVTTDSVKIMRRMSQDQGQEFMDYNPVYPYYAPKQ